MSGAITAAVVIAGGSAYAANKANKTAKAAAKGSGQVNTTTTNTPWGPDTDYRKWIMDQGANALGYNAGGVKGDPQQSGYTTRPDGRVVPIVPQAGKAGGKAGKGAKAPAAPAAAKTGGPVNTQQIIDDMYKNVSTKGPLVDPANKYAQTLLEGGETNAYRTEAADMVRGAGKNDNLDRMIADLFAGNTPGGGNGGNPAGVRGGRGGSSGVPAYMQTLNQPAAGQTNDKVGVKDDIRKILDGQGITPEYREMLNRQYQEAAQENARQMNALFVGSNMQGSSSWQDAFAKGQGQAAQGFSDELVGANFGLYQNALGLGTQYDISAEDRAAQMRMQQASLSASGRAGDASLAQQAELARMGMLGNAIGMQMQGQQFGAQGMSGISSLYSDDVQQAYGSVPGMENMDTAAWGQLGNLSLGQDSLRNSKDIAGMQINASRNAQNQQMAWDRERYYDPLQRLGGFADLVNASSGAYGSQQTTGTDTRAAGGAASYANPWSQAISGGLGAYSMFAGNGGAAGASPYGSWGVNGSVPPPTATGSIGSNL
jgi:hypothetical protein